MKIVAFCYGTTEIDERMAFQDGDKQKKIPISLMFFLIQQDEKNILVDVGCDTMPGFPLYTFCSPVEVLEKAGIKRSEITDVVLTHTHHDHADGLRYYKNAKVYVQENEIEYSKKYAPISENIVSFTDETEIAKGVTVKYIGGHSAGSCVVHIKTENREIVLCGDECYTRDNLLLKKPTGCSCRLEKSTEFVEKYSDEKYETVLSHDLAVCAEIGHKILLDEKVESNEAYK